MMSGRVSRRGLSDGTSDLVNIQKLGKIGLD
jgi:hypothetical protein